MNLGKGTDSMSASIAMNHYAHLHNKYMGGRNFGESERSRNGRNLLKALFDLLVPGVASHIAASCADAIGLFLASKFGMAALETAMSNLNPRTRVRGRWRRHLSSGILLDKLSCRVED